MLVTLVDSVPWAHEVGDGYLRRIAISMGDRFDTIPHVLTDELPLQARPGQLFIFGYEADAIKAVYQYDAYTRRLGELRLPDDFNPLYSSPSISPSGEHIAYLDVPRNGTAAAVVRSWPALDLVWKTESITISATDYYTPATRWLSPDTAEVFIDVGGSTWLRVSGSVRERRIIAVDTVYQLPTLR